jgi:hypothetical protein
LIYAVLNQTSKGSLSKSPTNSPVESKVIPSALLNLANDLKPQGGSVDGYYFRYPGSLWFNGNVDGVIYRVDIGIAGEMPKPDDLYDSKAIHFSLNGKSSLVNGALDCYKSVRHLPIHLYCAFKINESYFFAYVTYQNADYNSKHDTVSLINGSLEDGYLYSFDFTASESTFNVFNESLGDCTLNSVQFYPSGQLTNFEYTCNQSYTLKISMYPDRSIIPLTSKGKNDCCLSYTGRYVDPNRDIPFTQKDINSYSFCYNSYKIQANTEQYRVWIDVSNVTESQSYEISQKLADVFKKLEYVNIGFNGITCTEDVPPYV